MKTEEDQSRLLAFLALGLLNNSVFVILNSVAKEINASGVALVYLANSLPVFFVKLVGPYLFAYISYRVRFLSATFLFGLSLIIVAKAIDDTASANLALLGVALSSVAGGIGEPTILALATIYESRTTSKLMTWFSSGTGLAGIVGYSWTLLFQEILGLSGSTSLYLSVILPVLFWGTFWYFLQPSVNANSRQPIYSQLSQTTENEVESVKPIGVKDKLKATRYLWRYMVPLFTVYTAEYAMQSGTWASIGFPITLKSSRDNFYLKSNFLYQIGVFISRSSAIILPLSLRTLWILPALQTGLLVFFIWNTANQIFMSYYFLLYLSLIAGLFGGAVYVNSYILIANDQRIDPRLKEFSVAAASVADTTGIIVADFLGLVIQGCLYGINNITDYDVPPTFSCGYNFKP